MILNQMSVMMMKKLTKTTVEKSGADMERDGQEEDGADVEEDGEEENRGDGGDGGGDDDDDDDDNVSYFSLIVFLISQKCQNGSFQVYLLTGI